MDVLSFGAFEKLCALAVKNGVQVITHAIGDAAVAETIDHYECAIGGGKNLLRHGVVHYQITDSEMHARMARSGILAFVQPIFLDYDMHIVEERVGRPLAATSYAFGTLGKLGVPVSYGSDCPVEDCNPFPCIYCAVTRKDLSGRPEGGFYPEERVDLYDAIDCYTLGSAYAEFQESVKGRILPGYYADLIAPRPGHLYRFRVTRFPGFGWSLPWSAARSCTGRCKSQVGIIPVRAIRHAI